MSTIELKSATKRWGKTTAVDGISFAVEEGSFAVLLGPSGCGKSTILKMIAGLEEPTEGTVLIGDRDVTFAPPAERRLSMVFQSYALFPHLNVRENILFGLKVRKVAAAERMTRLEKVAAMVGLSDLLDRKPGQLSGGQRQRVALARAIIAENPTCLMDEPLSNLDAKLRHEMRIEIRALQQRLGMTVVYVTHDQTEAMSMADKVILMNAGRIEQVGTPEDLYNAPATVFCASFIGTPPMNILAVDGTVIRGVEGPEVLDAPRAVMLGVRPEHITIHPSGGVPARVLARDYLGAETIITATVGDQKILVRVGGRSTFAPGDEIGLSWDRAHAHIFDAATGRRDVSSMGRSIMHE